MQRHKDGGNTALTAALSYHEMGWSVIPVNPKSKKPAVSWKPYQGKRADIEQIEQWFSESDRNLAVVCGQVSGGLTVLDFDKPELYHQWKQCNPELADKLPTAKTGRGFHVFFRSDCTKSKKYQGWDLISEGKYVLLAPSVHESGCKYKWITAPDGELPFFPLSELNLTEKAEEREETEDNKDRDDSEAATFFKFDELGNDLKRKVNSAIEKTLPTELGSRNFMIFQFARYLKGMPEFEHCKAGQLKNIVFTWFERALPNIATKNFEETYDDFAYGWQKVKFPAGKADGLKTAVKKAMNRKNPLACEQDLHGQETKLLIRTCYELQRIQGQDNFWISTRDAAGILGISHDTANKRLAAIEEDGIIELKVGHTAKRARRYRFTGAI